MQMTRRDFAVMAGAAAMTGPAFAQTGAPLLTRAIPSSGEKLPAVGLGTAQVFNTADDATKQKAAAVVQALIANGGRLIDTASTYRDAEVVLGDVIAPAGLRDKLFIATKTEARRHCGVQTLIGAAKNREGRLAATPQRQRSAAIACPIQGMESARPVPLHRDHVDLS